MLRCQAQHELALMIVGAFTHWRDGIWHQHIYGRESIVRLHRLVSTYPPPHCDEAGLLTSIVRHSHVLETLREGGSPWSIG